METELMMNANNLVMRLLNNTELMHLTNENITETRELSFPEDGMFNRDEVCLYRVEQLSYDNEYPRREAFENVLMALDNPAFNFVYILDGTKDGIELNIGIVKNEKANLSDVENAFDYGECIEKLFEGNFNGSRLKRLYGMKPGKPLYDTIYEIPKKFATEDAVSGVIMGIPSINENADSTDQDFQGIDRLINSMMGLEWRMVVVCEPVSKEQILAMSDEIYNCYNHLNLLSKTSIQVGKNRGESSSTGSNTSDSNSKNFGSSESTSLTRGSSKNNDYSSSNRSKSTTKQTSEGISSSHTTGTNESFTTNTGESISHTTESINKKLQEVMKYIDEELLERLKYGFIKGMYQTSIYYMAQNPADANRLKRSISALFQGDSSTYSPLIAQDFDADMKDKLNVLTSYQNQYISKSLSNEQFPKLLGRSYQNQILGLNTFLTGKEIGLIAGLPQKEVPGVSLIEGVEFGLNMTNKEKQQDIELGCLVQRGRYLDNIKFSLDKNSLSKHVFIAGVTGSGKTTTCQKLLLGADSPFLVIEPAKTEYRVLIEHEDLKEKEKRLTVFTIGNETKAPFRLNPFEIIEGENLSSHIDMVKATFIAAFPMEASMPQLLEEAIILSYEKKGWDIENNCHKYIDDPFAKIEDPMKEYERTSCFPTLSEVLSNMSEVVKAKNFGDKMQGEYLGSLVSRLSNLTVGSKGRMLNCERSIDFQKLIHSNVILEMEDLKAPEDKSLIMGFVLARLSAEIKKAHSEDVGFKHLTLIEEAHRLLSKVEPGDSGSKKSSVETFTDLLAEVRKYGESLIVVDQIPNKLASEVLKNTNTKIVHRLFAKDDKEAIGDTMMMDDKQKEFLSNLAPGEAIIFSENTDVPVHVKIERKTDTNLEDVQEKVLLRRFQKKKAEFGICYDEYFMDIQNMSVSMERIMQGISKKGKITTKGYVSDVIDLREWKHVIAEVHRVTETHNKQEEKVWYDILNRYIKRNNKAEFIDSKRTMTSLEALYQILSQLMDEEEFPTKTWGEIKLEKIEGTDITIGNVMKVYEK